MATKSQLKKVERLANEIHSLWLEINENSENYRNSEIEKMQEKLNGMEENLNKYCIKIKITEDQLFSIDVISDLLDGVSYTDYILNY